jgi:predicted nucleic acid-binding Zn ribbon protein
MLELPRPGEVPAEGARALLDVPTDARPPVCCVCGKPLRRRQRQVCSGKCRAALSRGRKAEAESHRTRRVRVLLAEALRLLGETE